MKNPKEVQNQDVVVCIFNYNKNDNAQRLKSKFIESFKTYIFDSGSNPPCEGAIKYDNIYYGGMFNEAVKKSKNAKWCCIVTSDVEVSDDAFPILINHMNEVSNMGSVGCYQPSCDLDGRSHQYGYNKGTGKYRQVPYMEGWFQMFRTDLSFHLDLDVNRLGWGTDLYLSKRSRDRGLMNIVDDATTVHHPKETGFDNNEAMNQMRSWAATLPDFENNIRTGVGIICYEGTEHLRTIVDGLRSSVDNITLLWSDESYRGVIAAKNDYDEVHSMLAEGLVDDIIYFQNVQHLPERENETIRRNQAMSYFQKLGIDYALIMDSDEFYVKEELDTALSVIRTWLPQTSYVYYKNYYKHKNCLLKDDVYNLNRVVPFFCSTSLRFVFNTALPLPSDPTRRIPRTFYDSFFQKEMITMRHWSWIRDDISKKVNNWSASGEFSREELDEMIDYYEKFDNRQKYVRIPHGILKNKVEIEWE